MSSNGSCDTSAGASIASEACSSKFGSDYCCAYLDYRDSSGLTSGFQGYYCTSKINIKHNNGFATYNGMNGFAKCAHSIYGIVI